MEKYLRTYTSNECLQSLKFVADCSKTFTVFTYYIGILVSTFTFLSVCGRGFGPGVCRFVCAALGCVYMIEKTDGPASENLKLSGAKIQFVKCFKFGAMDHAIIHSKPLKSFRFSDASPSVFSIISTHPYIDLNERRVFLLAAVVGSISKYNRSR